ncbi:putative diacylglycerol pyrophosphate phosphatase 1 [Hyphodiscus hymeniophilus]|uniref:Diacylglycerol pyrophosphate phosphatase 1 n=1 Tax=Hyphodiscus hymeniophilus TaxID=353542 RepID=A0A9P6SL22_9HELO|nr:putative diacylglycerol pyrophosphate phosphatase 1 [Hyphodiscus hymeniophilus]
MSPRSGRSPNGGLTSRTGWIGSVARFWEKTYAPDYVGFAALITAYMLIQFLMEPFHRMFFLNNLNIQYPHALVERVPVGWNMIYAGAVPLLTLVLFLGLSRASLHKFHVTILGFFISIALTIFITDIVKNAVGRPRPDLISRCKPALGTPPDELVTIEVCTETDHHILHDGWRSFPSGHSSFAFSGLGFLALFFAGQLHVYRPRTDLGKVLIALAPLLGAAMIAISRCEDYRHDVYDVTCGSILGFSIAYFSYRRYFPRLHSANCDEPFPSREMSFNDGFGKIKNDEEATVRGAREYEVEDSDDGS